MTSLTLRSSGLVQRRTEASRNAAEKDRPSDQEDHELRRGDEQDEDDGVDSKETRLTLMEEVLLLGLKDREVNKWINLVLSRCKIMVILNIRGRDVTQANVSVFFVPKTTQVLALVNVSVLVCCKASPN